MSFGSLLKQCIAENAENRELHQKAKLSMHPSLYAREFKTIILNIGRDSGKTTTIINLYREGDLVIVRNREMKRRYPLGVCGNFMNIKTVEEFMGLGVRESAESERSFIFVDEYGCLSQSELNYLYNTTNAGTYILLGTPTF